MRTKNIPPEVLAQILSEQCQSRFWSHVDIRGHDECWIWQASGALNGYGVFNIKIQGRQNMFRSHRVAWIISNGVDIPDNLHVLHNCVASRRCCNPNHLHLGTQLDNMHEMDEQGRRVCLKGEDAPACKLREEDVLDIRAKYATGNFTHRSLAAIFGVTFTTIRKIVIGKNGNIFKALDDREAS